MSLTDEQIDGGFDAEGIHLMTQSILGIWAERYGENRSVTDYLAAVENRAARRAQERIGEALRVEITRQQSFLTANQRYGFREALRIVEATDA